MRVPYRIVSDYAFQLVDAAALSETSEERIMFWDAYEAYLSECGWTESEFDETVLIEIAENWETKSN